MKRTPHQRLRPSKNFTRALLPLLLATAWHCGAAETVTWSSEQFPVEEMDLASVTPDNPDIKKLAAFTNGSGGIAIAAPVNSKAESVLVVGSPTLEKGQDFDIALDQFRATEPTGWMAVTVGLRNAEGKWVGIAFNRDNYFVAQWTPEFRSLSEHFSYTGAADIKIRRKGANLLFMIDGKLRYTLEMGDEDAYTIPFVMAARQRPADGVVGVFSGAAIR